jgi:predicted ArsR family transcriptional regulator
MSHPLRLHIMSLLQEEGPLTATELAKHLETTPANCSFHLRLLARHGFVEEAAGGVGRQRPWQAVEEVRKIASETIDEESMPALRALDALELDYLVQKIHAWRDMRHEFPAEWRGVSGRGGVTTHLTAAELGEFKKRLFSLLDEYIEMGRPSLRRTGTAPVMIDFSLIPLRKPGGVDA